MKSLNHTSMADAIAKAVEEFERRVYYNNLVLNAIRTCVALTELASLVSLV